MREELSRLYLSGEGIEIGALCHPLKVDGAVIYVDRFDLDGIHNQYPDIPTEIINKIDVIDDGELLSKFNDNSKNFIIANHFLEHCINPIGTIENWLRVLKTGGYIFCAIPDKDFSFDKCRELTTIEHLLKDYEGLQDEYAHFIEASAGEGDAQTLFNNNYSIHRHVWDKNTIKEFFQKVSELLPVEEVDYRYNDERNEFIFILRSKK